MTKRPSGLNTADLACSPRNSSSVPLSPAQRIIEDRANRANVVESPYGDNLDIPGTVQVGHMRDGRATPECMSPVPFGIDALDSPVPSIDLASPELDAHMAALEAEIVGLRTKDQRSRALPSLQKEGTQHTSHAAGFNFDEDDDDRRGVGRPDLAATRRLSLPVLDDELCERPKTSVSQANKQQDDQWLEMLQGSSEDHEEGSVPLGGQMPPVQGRPPMRKRTSSRLAPLENAAVPDPAREGSSAVAPRPPVGAPRRNNSRSRRNSLPGMGSQGNLALDVEATKDAGKRLAPLNAGRLPPAPTTAQLGGTGKRERNVNALERTTHPIVRGDAALRGSTGRRFLEPLAPVLGASQRSTSLPRGLPLPLPPVANGSESGATEANRMCAKAVLCQKQGSEDEAAQLFDKALAVCPSHVEALVRRGLMLVKQGSFAKAEPLLRRAANFSGGTAEEQNLASRAYTVLEQYCGPGVAKVLDSDLDVSSEPSLDYSMEY